MAKVYKNYLEAVLKRFDLQQLCSHAMNEFPEIIWDDILIELREKKKKINKRDVIGTILKLADDINSEELKQITENLQLLAVVLTSSRTWYIYELVGNPTLIPATKNELLSNLQKSFRISNIPIDKFNIIDFDGKFVISIVKRSRNRKKNDVEHRYYQPVHFIFDSTSKYIFANKEIEDVLFIETVTNSLGYKKFKFIKLKGKNIEDLNRLLINKNNKRLLEFKIPEFEPKIKLTGRKIDFTENNEKLEYAENLYGEDPPELQSITINAEDAACSHELMSDVPFKCSLQLTSPNVIKLLKDCIKDGIIDTPVPDYMTDIFKKGRNVFKIHNE